MKPTKQPKPSGQEKRFAMKCPNCKIHTQKLYYEGVCSECGYQPPQPPLQGKQDWEKRLRENFEVDGYIDCHIDVMIDFIQSAIHTTEKRMIEEINSIDFVGTKICGWHHDKGNFEEDLCNECNAIKRYKKKIMRLLNHSKQG